MTTRKKSKDLKLPDFKKILKMLTKKSDWMFDGEIVEKIKRKIDKLENPPERKVREKVEFQCKSCDKKFKRAPIICPECEEEDIVRLDKWT